jgi:hypothetical protein
MASTSNIPSLAHEEYVSDSPSFMLFMRRVVNAEMKRQREAFVAEMIDIERSSSHTVTARRFQESNGPIVVARHRHLDIPSHSS